MYDDMMYRILYQLTFNAYIPIFYNVTFYTLLMWAAGFEEKKDVMEEAT